MQIPEDLQRKTIAFLEKQRHQAKEYTDDPKKVAQLFDAAKKKLQGNPQLAESWDSLQLMLEMLRAWGSGKYHPAASARVAIILGLLYLVNPFDLIPDTVPIIGQIDDIVVVGVVLKQVHGDLVAFREWRDSQVAAAGTTEQ